MPLRTNDDSVRVSLAELRRVEQQRLARERELQRRRQLAEKQARDAAAQRERERRERQEAVAAEQRRREEAERAEVAARQQREQQAAAEAARAAIEAKKAELELVRAELELARLHSEQPKRAHVKWLTVFAMLAVLLFQGYLVYHYERGNRVAAVTPGEVLQIREAPVPLPHVPAVDKSADAPVPKQSTKPTTKPHPTGHTGGHGGTHGGSHGSHQFNLGNCDPNQPLCVE